VRFDILTIFPDFFGSPLAEGMIRRALQDGLVSVNIHNIRDFAEDRHAMTDDRPFGGGEGMVMKPEPLAAAVRHVRAAAPAARVVLLSPQGRTLNQEIAADLAGEEQLILVCGRYEGVDERFRAAYVDREVSIGDYILTGGEPAALVLLDCLIRLLPGVLGCGDSAENDTFSPGSRGGLKYPQYTRPRVFEGMAVPEILLSGDHAAIAAWRFCEAVRRTMERRPELLAAADFSPAERKLLARHGLLPVAQRVNPLRPAPAAPTAGPEEK
jgi:tRNA (guanine37-N1)-methyltransferase